jgi:hypothetical protein
VAAQARVPAQGGSAPARSLMAFAQGCADKRDSDAEHLILIVKI